MGPALNLSVAAAVLGLLYLAFRIRRGWFWRWQGRRGVAERIEIEDALKHLYNCSESGAVGSIESIAGVLAVSRDMASHLADRLEQRALVATGRSGLALTDEGRLYALQVIRTHRLWEQYLAQETGIEEQEWHEQADRIEHRLTPDQADALSAKMGFPAFDPHGDPIPSATGTILLPDGQPLNTVAAGNVVRVVHIEDEPESTYRLLREARLQPGTTLSVVDSAPEGVALNDGVAQFTLAPVVAANVTVRPVEGATVEQVSVRRLSSLEDGEEATVADIAPACRGVERRRLLDLGLVPVRLSAPNSRVPQATPSPTACRGALIALRNQQADLIHMEQVAGKAARG